MQHERAMNMLTGQSNLVRKVFAAVPRQEFWSIGQISNEMNRVEKHNNSKAEITGCLRHLVDAGLVAEAGLLTFRSNVKPPKLTLLKETQEVSAPPKKKETPKPSLMDRTFTVASKLREAAEEIEQLGMEVDSAILEAGKGNAQLLQLQETLRGLLGNS